MIKILVMVVALVYAEESMNRLAHMTDNCWVYSTVLITMPMIHQIQIMNTYIMVGTLIHIFRPALTNAAMKLGIGKRRTLGSAIMIGGLWRLFCFVDRLKNA